MDSTIEGALTKGGQALPHFVDIVASLAAAYYRRMWSAWLKRLNAYLLARKMAEQKAQERLSDVEERARKEQEEMVLHFAEQGEPGMDLAEWKRYDNEQLARYERIRQADLAFDAEVGDLTTEEWYQVQQRAVGLRIELVQQQAREVCDGEDPLACAQAWAQANQAVEGLVREAALQPQTVYTPPEPRGEACPAGEAQWYREQMAEIQQVYTWALEHDPDRIPEIAASMNQLAEEAAADGCQDVMIAARVEGGRMTEIAWDIQEGKALGIEPLPPPDYVVVGVSHSLAPLGKLGGKVAGKIVGEVAGEVVGQVLTKPLEVLSGGGNIIWVEECSQVLLCGSSSVGLSPWPVSGKAGFGWVEGGLACEQTVATFEQATPELEAGVGLGLSKLNFAGRPRAEMGLYTPQIATGVIVSEVLPSSCTIIWDGKTP